MKLGGCTGILSKFKRICIFFVFVFCNIFALFMIQCECPLTTDICEKKIMWKSTYISDSDIYIYIFKYIQIRHCKYNIYICSYLNVFATIEYVGTVATVHFQTY